MSLKDRLLEMLASTDACEHGLAEIEQVDKWLALSDRAAEWALRVSDALCLCPGLAEGPRPDPDLVSIRHDASSPQSDPP